MLGDDVLVVARSSPWSSKVVTVVDELPLVVTVVAGLPVVVVLPVDGVVAVIDVVPVIDVVDVLSDPVSADRTKAGAGLVLTELPRAMAAPVATLTENPARRTERTRRFICMLR